MGVRTELIGQLKTKLRSIQVDSTPDDLDLALDDAVQAYSELRPRLTPLTISWTAGQGTVTLPEDFVRMEADTWAALTEAPADNINMYDGRSYGYHPGLYASPPGQYLRPAMGPGQPAAYTIYPGYPPTLVIQPAPAQSGSIDARCYRSHKISDVVGETTVPLPDHRLVVLEGVYQFYRSVVLERGLRPIQFDATGDGNGQRVRMADPETLQKMADSCHAEFARRINQGAA